MKILVSRFWRLITVLVIFVGAFGSQSILAQESPFSAAIIVNGRVVTNYELKQRIIFFSLLQPNADSTKEARNSLIDDRLRQGAAEQLGVVVSPEDVTVGMESFASRANLTADEFLKALAPRGVAPETFRDFVQAGVLWRETIKAKFLSGTKVSEGQIDRAIEGGIAAGGELKLLLSEIIIKKGGVSDARQLAERIKGDVVSAPGFAAAARLHSSAATATTGGQLDWLTLADLPPNIAAQLAALEPGQMTDVIDTEDSVALFYLRDRSTSKGDAAVGVALDFVHLLLPAGADTAAIVAKADRCEDLLPLGRDLPEETVLRETLPEGSVPSEYAAVLRGLDRGEIAAVPNAAGQTLVLMVCSRQPMSDFAPSRDDVRTQLLNQKMGLRAQTYLEQLRAEALIVEP